MSDHGLEEMLEDDINALAILDGVSFGTVVEDYPDAFKGPSVLVLQSYEGRPVHVVWGLARENPDTATLITAYFPDPAKWYEGYLKRRKP